MITALMISTMKVTEFYEARAQESIAEGGSCRGRTFSTRGRLGLYEGGHTAGLIDDFDVQFRKLLVRNRAWRLRHQVHGAGRFRKSDHFADRLLASQDHNSAIEAEGDPAVRR